MSDIRQAFAAPAYVGGNPSPGERLVRAYRYWRQQSHGSFYAALRKPYTAAEALEKARADVANGKARYPASAWPHGQGWNPESGGARWVERLESAGLRFVAWADEILSSRGQGWYSDSDGSEVYRGAVLQLPARDGRSRFIAAYADPNNEGAYRVDVSRPAISEGMKGGIGGASSYGWKAENDDGARQAARMADRFAEREASDAREYEDAWQAGSRWASLGDDIKADRAEALAILAERRKVPPVNAPALCKAIRSQVAHILARIEAARSARAELTRYIPQSLQSAFLEGAGVETFPG